jgi:hypothetical protein
MNLTARSSPAAGDRLLKHRVGLGDEQVDPDGGSVQRLQAEVRRFGRLICDAKPAVAHGHFCDDPPVRIGTPVDLLSAERPLVEVHRGSRVPDDENGRDGAHDLVHAVAMLQGQSGARCGKRFLD